MIRDGRVLIVSLLSFSRGKYYEGPINLMVLPTSNESQPLYDEASTGVNTLRVQIVRDDISTQDKTLTFFAFNHVSNITTEVSLVVAGKFPVKIVMLDELTLWSDKFCRSDYVIEFRLDVRIIF